MGKINMQELTPLSTIMEQDVCPLEGDGA